jgi:hypothetical protein
MNRGILFAVLSALALCAVAPACHRSPDPAQLRTVDSLITSIDAALLTLNELDPVRYAHSDSLHAQREALFNVRFTDTLDRTVADALATPFLVLRSAARMGEDHRRVVTDLEAARIRLAALQTDLSSGAMEPETSAAALVEERNLAVQLDSNVHWILDNYRSLQRVWDDLPRIDSLLTADPTTVTATAQHR